MASQKQTLGNWGEEKAVLYLKEKGCNIRERNYRFKRAEVDIIAQLDNLLLFVEVKTRSGTDYGYPEDFVSERKMELYEELSEHYVKEQRWKGWIRFDVVAVTKNNDKFRIDYFEDIS